MNPDLATHHASLRAWLRQRTPDDATADDLVHDVLLRAHERRDQLNDPAKLRAWLYAIARSVWLDSRRRQRPHEVLHDLPAEDSSTEDPLTEVASAMAEWAVRGLPEPYRTAVWRVDYEGVSQAALARELGVSPSGVRSRVQRGRAMARDALLACCSIAWEDGQVQQIDPSQSCSCAS